MTTMRNRLSTLSDSSMTYPVRKVNAALLFSKRQSPAAKISASATQTATQIAASGVLTACALRETTPKSSASIARTNPMNPTQNQMLVAMVDIGVKAKRSGQTAPAIGDVDRVITVVFRFSVRALSLGPYHRAPRFKDSSGGPMRSVRPVRWLGRAALITVTAVAPLGAQAAATETQVTS